MKKINPTLNVFSKISLGLIFILLSTTAFAEAGRVVFVYGTVTAEGTNGISRVLAKRDYVEAGETIRTSTKSLVQMRMIDKAFIALRSSSEIKIEAYKLGITKEEDSGIFSLLKGGFRAVTGIIGKRLRSAYKMTTSTATIGIRGTDYTARLCDQDCNQAFGNLAAGNSIADGLYVGVNNGGINLTNDLGTLSLDELQFGYVKDATTAPVALISAPEFLYFNSRAPNPDEEQAGSAETDAISESSVTASRAEIEPVSSDINTDDNIKQDLKAEQVEVAQDQIEQNVVIDQVAETQSGNEFSLTEGTISSSRMVAVSVGKLNEAGAISAIYSNPFNSAKITAENDLEQFENQFIDNRNVIGTYSAGSSTTIDLGFDPSTGIAWGRWGAGLTQFQALNSSNIVNPEYSSSHWVISPDQSQNIALPSSGSATYQWVGNTTPTDNLGNTGILGNATLDANFTNMTVDTSVAVGINNEVWSGAASGLPILSNGGFSGNLSNVNINNGTEILTGSGDAAGFFTNNATGAGMGFSMQSGTTSVTGTAVFQKP